MANADGTERRAITPAGMYGLLPAWSPDGKMIAFSRYDPTSYGSAIYLVGADGTGLRLLTEGGRFPSWQP
jgi:Tol biopolymer transport system component